MCLQEPQLQTSEEMYGSILKKGLNDNHTSHYSPVLALLGYIVLEWNFYSIWKQLPQNNGCFLVSSFP